MSCQRAALGFHRAVTGVVKVILGLDQGFYKALWGYLTGKSHRSRGVFWRSD